MESPLHRERWRRIDAILDVSLDLPAEERHSYVAAACEGDPELQHEVEELLAASAASEHLFATPAAERAAVLVADRVLDPVSAGSLVGRIVGRYRLIRQIGEGGMGVVFVAERADGEFEQRVAIKLVKQGLFGDAARQRFLQERQILARLQHPSIARLLDGGVTDEGAPFLVMEYVDGRPVTAYCDIHAPRVDERLRIFLQICDAVQSAHRSLIVHRDLKPSNILVDDTGRVKLLDFGIAKLIDDSDGAPASGQTVFRALTPDYAAPEQLRGEPVSTSTDVYALGVLLFELLTGERPHRGGRGSLGELERAILEQEPAAPSTRVEDRERRHALRGDLDRVVLKALDKAPARRYPSVEAFAADVERHLAGRPVLAHGDALPYRAAKFVRRHRVGVAAAALVLLTLVGGLVATTWEARRAAREARKAEAVKDFLKSLFSAADPAAAQGREPSVRQLLDRGAARIETDLAGQPDVQSEVVRVVASVYQSLGEYDRIPPLLTRDLDRRRRIDGPRSLAVAELLTQIADARYEQNRFDESARMYEEALAIQRERRGNDAPQVAELLWDLAGVARNRGNLAGAESLQKEALASWIRSKGEESAEATGARESLAITYGQGGRFLESTTLQQRVVEWRETHLGPDHPDTLTSRYNFAFNLYDLGRYADALTMIEDVIARQRRVLGARHDRLAVSLRMLARIHDAAGRAEEARAPIAEALAIQSEQLGATSYQAAVDRAWQAVVDADTGDLNAAERSARAARDVFDRLAPAPAAVPLWRSRAGRVLAEAGRLDEADVQIQRAVSDLRAARNDGPILAIALDALGAVALERREPQRAANLSGEALRIFEREKLPDHPAAALARVHAGAAAAVLGSLSDGERQMRQGIAQLEHLFPGGHQDLAASRAALGDALVAASRGAEARPLLESALAWREAHLGPADRRTARVRAALAAAKR